MQRLARLRRCFAGALIGAVLPGAVALPWGVAVAGEERAGVAGFAPGEALRLGERIYRQGIGADGTPIRAVVAGDVQIDGGMFACVNCHQRSGLGSVEGSVVAWPVTGKELSVPMRRAKTWNPGKQHDGPGAVERWELPPHFRAPDQRPAYSDDTVVRALRTGIDSAGRSLNRAMPRFDLDERDMALLVNYLNNLSRDADPGVDEQVIRFATVVTDGVDAADREAMLATLRASIDAHNVQTRPYERRAKAGPFYKTEKYGAYRRLVLDVWELHGAPSTWGAQLHERYAERPVFALLGGIAKGSWAPIHEFCEAQRLPAIFPVTEQPVVSDSDWYTLYISKGAYQEGAAAVRYLHASGNLPAGARVVQVFRAGSRGEDAARGAREAWSQLGANGIVLRELGPEALTAELARDRADENGQPTAWLLWLEGAELSATLATVADGTTSAPVVASWTLAEGQLDGVHTSLRNRLYLTHPRQLPEQQAALAAVVERWLAARHLPRGDPDIQADMYLIARMLPAAIDYLRNEFYRDYFLEAFDMMPQQDNATPGYPRLSFGPGQRYAAKGCYVTRLSATDPPRLLPVSEWVVN